jgi:hypothetical protein
MQLYETAGYQDDAKNVSAGMGELVVTAKGEFDCDAETLDGHDGDGPDSGAY